MASAAAAIDQAANPKSVDESLWWDSFVNLIDDLENASDISTTDIPSSLVKKLNSNHAWFLDTVSLFKPQSQKSKAALDSQQVNVGPHRLIVQPELKDIALQLSHCLGLDEVQSYIIVERFVERENVAVDVKAQEFLHLIILQYYIERQCLLKCTRQIIMHALYMGNDGSKESDAIRDEASKLISDGLEMKLLNVLQDLLSSKHPEHLEVDLATVWAEETLIEDNLVLDILFLAYYESLCTCNGENWKSLCSLYKGMLSGSFNFEKLAISIEARSSLYHSKVQLLLILIEALDLENLLQMVHDQVPFRQGHSVFSLMDIQDMDGMISSFNVFETEEAGPLILAWAVFLCLVSSLPEKQECSFLADMDHVGYVRQAFEAAPLNYLLEILQNDLLKDSDGPVAGYRSVMRTFVSAFIASYEINLQLEDDTLNLILDILCGIYRGEESLCVQFWDKESFIDGPVRCLLCTLEGEFPFRIVEVVRFLSALCEGTWPAECVYNFLDKSVGISSLFKVPGDACMENISQIIETRQPLYVPGVEALLIPSQTRGQVLKVVDGNNCLVRWEYMQSGVFVLLLRLAREFYVNTYEEIVAILDLFYRLVSFNTAVCFALMDIDNSFQVQAARMNGQMEKSLKVDVVEIICTLVRNLPPNISSAVVMSTGISILAKLLKCSPSHVISVVLKKNIFDVALRTNSFASGNDNSSSGAWLLSGGLARMLLLDCDQTEECCHLTISGMLNILDFTMQLVETGAEDDIVLALVVFSLQYVLVNHENWKYKLKHVRWKVTLKVLEVMKKCITWIPSSQRLGAVVRDILLCDSSIHNTLCRIMCTTSQTLESLYVSRLYEVKEIEGLQDAVCSVLDILFTMLAAFSKDAMSSVPAFHQAMLSSATKPIPVVTAAMSLISYFHESSIQVGAARVLSMLCIVAENAQPYLFGSVCLVSDDLQIRDLRYSICEILCEETSRNEDLFVAIVQLLTSAARYQPAFLVSIVATKEHIEVPLNSAGDMKQQPLEPSSSPSLVDALMQRVKRSEELIERHPNLLLNVLNFLKVLWQGATQYMQILELLKNNGMFWKQLSSSVSAFGTKKASSLDSMSENETLCLAYKYQCHSAVLEIMAHDMFLKKKVLQAESLVKQTSALSKERIDNKVTAEKSVATYQSEFNDILSAWFESSVMGNLLKSYASCGFDNEIFLRAKIASSLFIVHVMGKLIVGDAGSLSLSLIKMIKDMSKKLFEQPAFSELIAQYSLRGYSQGKQVNSLILSDLYFHLQGELEGRMMSPGPFKELSGCLLESKFWQNDEHKCIMDISAPVNDASFFDLVHLQADLGLEFWDHSDWKASKAIAERMLLCMKEANSMLILANSKLSALQALTTIISMHGDNFIEIKTASVGGRISEPLLESCIEHICKCLLGTVESLVPSVDASKDILNFFAAQVKLLLHLLRFLSRILSEKTNKRLPLPMVIILLKTTGAGLRVLSSIRPSTVGLRRTMKLFLMLLLASVKLCYPVSSIEEKPDIQSVEACSEVSLLSLGLLPILCNSIETSEYCTLSLASMDLILKLFLTANTWLPILQKHLRLHIVIQKLQEKDSLGSIPVILKFLLTLARVRGGAEMLQTSGFFSSLKVLFALSIDGKPFLNIQDESLLSTSCDKDEKNQHIWGLGLAVVTAMINSLGDSACVDFVDSVTPYFSEHAYLVFYYLNAPDFQSADHDRKRARTRRTQTSLSALREMEQTLVLICILAKHLNIWVKAMKDVDSQLRERSIHLLAFISRGPQRAGESPSRTAPLLCPPMLKEEIEDNGRPSFVGSKHGWFALSPLGLSQSKASAFSSTALISVTEQATTENTVSIVQTRFSDAAAIQIYKNALLLLEFLCLQAKGAVNRAHEVGFIDLPHFPELPMPEILHGLQDQAIAIVTEICQANKKLKHMQSEIQDVCFLLLQLTEKALFLELCVSQTCGIRPVQGRVEDFSKEIKLLIEVAEQHERLKASVKSLIQVISLVYPGLLQTDGFL
ncbi:hypothetical protein BVC80_8889g25 [Macleaya cordata]|uniref:Nucleoporin Nup188 N-terminal domain-containing protein n=1 Tax=Macleaya cordata TaxID=56857 RepID=A0A200Q740_MACCD|nr:hypothetical protein BVC80_8889g25 [Macleaya cordata]